MGNSPEKELDNPLHVKAFVLIDRRIYATFSSAYVGEIAVRILRLYSK